MSDISDKNIVSVEPNSNRVFTATTTVNAERKLNGSDVNDNVTNNMLINRIDNLSAKVASFSPNDGLFLSSGTCLIIDKVIRMIEMFKINTRASCELSIK
ncbi:hypothetical protein GCM10008107_00760 [Psychrosphaera saromensis]|nr:hypothetical protein GCM10008107_00760 [Psychrosphaera saromensis]GLQ13798.1 hypothetical protein GCM10007917_12530 [Psychrosphaera saromensis]